MRIEIDQALVDKKLKAAQYDLKRAKHSLTENDDKWATIKAYYSMFHAAKALLYSKGFREKSHYCLLVGIKELFVDKGILDHKHYDAFGMALDLRHDADYGLIYSIESAEIVVKNSEDFLISANKILGF
jgi:uncharacterized protein (UPF0332 family)